MPAIPAHLVHLAPRERSIHRMGLLIGLAHLHYNLKKPASEIAELQNWSLSYTRKMLQRGRLYLNNPDIRRLTNTPYMPDGSRSY